MTNSPYGPPQNYGQPHPQQPQQPQQQQQQPHPRQPQQQPHPQQQQPSTTNAPRRPSLFADGGTRNPLGRAAFWTGVALIAVSFLFQIVQGLIVGSGDYESLGFFSFAHGILIFLLATAAIVLALIALARKGASKVLAAIGLGVGAYALISILSGFLYSAIVQVGSNF